MKTNYVLIDYENVQPEAMAALDQEHFKVIVFVGVSQAKVTFEVASVLQRMGPRAEYVKISGNGSNALDFHIAFYIGQIAAREPEAHFHIVSKDTGFDPLIAHLKSKQIVACRAKTVNDVLTTKAPLKTANTKTPEEKLAIILANLKHRGASLPRTLKTLSSTIRSLFKKQLPEEELAGLIEALKLQGAITVDGTKVTYNLPA